MIENKTCAMPNASHRQYRQYRADLRAWGEIYVSNGDSSKETKP
jgi:hypothetical protein